MELEGNEYVTRKKRVRELGAPFFDFVNYAPLDQVKKTLFNFMNPNIQIPQDVQLAFSNNYQVNDFNNLEKKLDLVVERLDKINQKEYQVNVKTSFKGVEFAREMQKANDEYQRRIK